VERVDAIAAWVDGCPELIAQLPEDDDLLAVMFEQECIAVALSEFYDARKASGRIRASVMADILASAPDAARKDVVVAGIPRRKHFDDGRRMVWIGALLGAAACVVLVLATRQPPPAEHAAQDNLAAAAIPVGTPAPATQEPIPQPQIVESPPSRLPDPAVRESLPEAPAPVAVAEPETSSPDPVSLPETASPTPQPTVVAMQSAPGRDPTLRPFSNESHWNLPLAEDAKLSGVRLFDREKNIRLRIRRQAVCRW